MSLANWEKIKKIFLEAIELAPENRARFLEEKCGGDIALRAEIEQLIRQDEAASGLMSRPAIEKTAARVFAGTLDARDPLIGEKVGAYHLVEEIGRGGMGAVYLAERIDGEFKQKVAVKLIKRGMETEFILRRFRNERQVLAALSHPFIARLYDGGTALGGVPYFVMEYVAGEPLYKFCDARKLSVKERLEVFLHVCEAVHAAHKIKVVHRDLKPSNILVKPDGTPKLLDFGIAKLLDEEIADTLIEQTATAMRMMTPEYATPEQVGGGEITPASDIYSLGVILYELLSGHRPYRLRNRTPLEIARVVCEQPPERLSRSLESRETFLEKGEAATLERVLDARGADLSALRHSLSGDVEQIVMTTLRKRADDRYQTVLELAEDIRLYLENKPLKARPQTANQTIPAADDKSSLAVLPLKIIGAPATGRTEEGIRETATAERIAPFSLRTKTMVAFAFYQAHRFEEALQKGQQIMEIDRNYPQAYAQIAISLWGLKRHKQALLYAVKFNDLIPDSAYVKYQLCFALAQAGKLPEAKKILEEIKTLARSGYVKPYFLGMAHAAVGQRDEAFRYFEQSFAEDDPWMLWFGVEPMLDALRTDARYADLLRRMNNPLAEKYPSAEPAEKDAGTRQKSIAVLPLQIIGAPAREDADDKYLSLGLAEAMINRLLNVGRLVVRPTSAILRFGEGADASAGGELNVDYVLSGTIRRAGARIRVSGQLLDIRTNATVWAEKFDENFTDVLELEDTVAERVAGLLIPRLTGEEQKKLAKRSTASPEAFEAYLRGRYHLYQMIPAEFVKAKTYFEDAIRLDADYALAYIGLAEYYFILGTFTPMPPIVCYENSHAMAERAPAIDDSLGEAYGILGYTYFRDFDFEKIEQNLARSLELNPNNSFALIWRSGLATYFGRFDEAIADSKRMLELNPLGAFEKTHYLWILYQARRFDEAVEFGRKAVDADPHFAHGLGAYCWILRHVGKTDEAIEYARRNAELLGGIPRSLRELASCYAKAGETEKAHQILQELEAAGALQYVSPCNLAITYLNLGDRAPAF